MTSFRLSVGEYAIRVAGRSGRVAHLIHQGQVGYPTPAACCGLESSSFVPNLRDLRLCKSCALHAEFRGVSAADLYPEAAS